MNKKVIRIAISPFVGIFVIALMMAGCIPLFPLTFLALFYAWEKESGFSGEIWASFQEFLEYEWLYENGEYMKNLLTKDEYEEYLKSIEKENDMENKNDYSQIDACAMSILNDSIDDYASRIYEKIKFFVREDVIQSSGISDKGDMENFSDGDVKLSIGRALCKNLNMEF